MATKQIPLTDIVDNPFQPRTDFDPAALKSLADEIKAEGFWAGGLQGRRTKNGKIELVFGHRRLRALKLLKTESVPIEIVDLTDAQMALRSLEENLQREGLTDLEKADGVRQAVKIEKAELKARKESESHAIPRVAKRLGFSPQYVAELVEISSGIPEKIRPLIEAGYLTAETAHRAQQWGGSGYVSVLASQGKQAKEQAKLPATKRTAQKPTKHTVTAMKQVVQEAPEAIRQKLQEAIWAGEVLRPDAAAHKANRLAAERTKRNKRPPENLETYLVGWQHRFEDWTELLKQLDPYLEFVETVPAVILDPFLEAQSTFFEATKALRDVRPTKKAPRVIGRSSMQKRLSS